MIAAIHQPNFFPWLGYFDKIKKSDTFVFMDDIAHPKTGGTWCNHVKILIQGKPAWITCPIVRKPGTQLIKNVRIDDRQPWRKKILKGLEYNYRKAPYFEESWEWVKGMFLYKTDLLAEFNIHNIKEIMEKISCGTSFTLQSKIETSQKATSLLIEIIKKIGSDIYLCGNGCSGYQEDEKFWLAGIKLIYQKFQHPRYPQLADNFIPGLSVLDVLFNWGYGAINQWLNSTLK
jgi:hypothetical protein